MVVLLCSVAVPAAAHTFIWLPVRESLFIGEPAANEPKIDRKIAARTTKLDFAMEATIQSRFCNGTLASYDPHLQNHMQQSDTVCIVRLDSFRPGYESRFRWKGPSLSLNHHWIPPHSKSVRTRRKWLQKRAFPRSTISILTEMNCCPKSQPTYHFGGALTQCTPGVLCCLVAHTPIAQRGSDLIV